MTWNYISGSHNVKIGAQYDHWFLTENDGFGIVDPGLLPGIGCPDPTNPICSALAAYDLTAGGQNPTLTKTEFVGKDSPLL